MALKQPWVDLEELLVEASNTQPESEKSFDAQHDLKTAESIGADLSEDLCKHVDTGCDSDQQGIGHDFTHMHHDRFSGFSRLIGVKCLFHLGHKEVVGKEKTAIGKDGKKVDEFDDHKSDGRSLVMVIMGAIIAIELGTSIDFSQLLKLS